MESQGLSSAAPGHPPAPSPSPNHTAGQNLDEPRCGEPLECICIPDPFVGTFPQKPWMLWKKLYLNLNKVIPVSVGRQCSSCRVLYQYSVLPPGSCSFAVASTCADLIFSHRAVKDLVKISYISVSRSSQFICDMTNISAIRIFPSLSSLNALTYIPNHCLI